MRDRLIPPLVTLTAGAITCIVDIYQKAELIPSLKRLLLVLIIFYIIGLIAKAIIVKTLQQKSKNDDQVNDDIMADDNHNNDNHNNDNYNDDNYIKNE